MLINFSRILKNNDGERRVDVDWRFLRDSRASQVEFRRLRPSQFVDFVLCFTISPSSGAPARNVIEGNVCVLPHHIPSRIGSAHNIYLFSFHASFRSWCVSQRKIWAGFGKKTEENDITTSWGVNFCCHHYYCLGIILSQIHQNDPQIASKQ